MARRKQRGRKGGSRKRGKRSGGGIVQRLLVGLSVIVLVLCAASITYSFFMRGGSPDDPPRALRLKVLNGVGTVGLANDAARALKRRGVDVIDTDNAPRFDYKQSVLIARRHSIDAEALARELGCSKVIVQIDEQLLEDATLILGDDYRELKLDWED
jgi:hypothetical protein